ncbi:MAG TPA: hypothetical protein VMV89_13135 [Candidatus Paceibacterota bacterium]|nr:hypothetical protein [Candidatus Paceibacterota bacterium]
MVGKYGVIRAENSFAAGITTNFLIMGAITKLDSLGRRKRMRR